MPGAQGRSGRGRGVDPVGMEEVVADTERRGRSGRRRPASRSPSLSSAPSLPALISRPRTRVPRRGGGVHVRAGRGRGVVRPLESLEEGGEGVVEGAAAVAANRGGPNRRVKGRGGRGFVHERPGPHSIEELRNCNILELPEAQALETPLHPRRERMWPSSELASAAFALPPAPSTPPSTSPPLPSPSPSPALFMDVHTAESASTSSVQHPLPPPPPCRPRQVLRDEDVEQMLNYGSDSGSDESNDDVEESIVLPAIPRVFRSIMETPLDAEEEDAVDELDPLPAAPAADSELGSVPPTATDQPWRWYDFDWKEFPSSPIPPESRRETFSQSNSGPTTPRDNPYDTFIDIWDRPIMEHIASETNRYAQQVAAQMMNNKNLHPTSRIGRWFDTTVDELYTYLGLVLAMGIVVKSRLEDYWTATPDIFYTPGFSAHMSIDRFIAITKCLHFADNDAMCALELDGSEARLYKIQPILSHLNMKFQYLYTPAQNIALDESLLMWKGWLENGQLIPNKVAKKGIKTYEICESQTGYLWRFEIQANKKSHSPPQQVADPLEAATPSIVLRLTQGLEHKGYTLWMDNFYNSPCLARRLKSLGFDCVGTLRTDRKFVPQALHNLTKRNMVKGQVAGLTSGDVDAMVWRDSNRVAMISTYHGNGQQTSGGSTQPILILDYNIMMGGVDKKDQLLAMYPIEQTPVWYKKLFRRLLNVSVMNSYIIHRHSSSSITHRNFRISLIKTLLCKHHVPHIFSATSQNRRFDVSHRIEIYDKGVEQRLRRLKCEVCNRRTQTFCVGCKKTLCIKNCFLAFHS